MRRTVMLLVLAVLALAPPASADVTLAAMGTTTFTTKTTGGVVRTCTTTTSVQFHQSAAGFVLNEATPAGQAPGVPPVCASLAIGSYTNSPTIRQCTPNGGIVIPGSTITVSGSTYTIRTPYQSCGGQTATDTIVLTVSASSIVYKHDVVDPRGEIHVTGTLARQV